TRLPESGSQRHPGAGAGSRGRRSPRISQIFRRSFRMTDAKLNQLRRLKKLLDPGEIRFDEKTLEAYVGDKWFATHRPDAVALPRTTKSVATLLRFATRYGIPVTPRGAGHGYVGGCVPLRGGIALSLERMNRIKEINVGDFVAVVQPGVNTAQFQE